MVFTDADQRRRLDAFFADFFGDFFADFLAGMLSPPDSVVRMCAADRGCLSFSPELL